ncbi:MAG: hypothetical protein H6983_04590 [Ectothiorhodospiraceae bacterium]|nr:hypothetical protein [Ectothiorhodospiraceae bacterium]
MSARRIPTRRKRGIALGVSLILLGPATHAAEQLRFQGEPLDRAVAAAARWLDVPWELVATPEMRDVEVSATISRSDPDIALASILRGFDYYVVVNASTERIHLVGRPATHAAAPGGTSSSPIRPTASPRPSQQKVEITGSGLEGVPGPGPHSVVTRDDGVVEVYGPKIVADDGSVWEYGVEADGSVELVRVSGPTDATSTR